MKDTSFYLIHGNEYLVEQATVKVMDHIRGRVGDDVAVEIVDCEETDAGSVVEAILSPSLFSVNKISVLKHLKLTGSSRWAAEIERTMEAGLAPGQFVVVVPDKVDKRIKLVKRLAKQGEVLELGGLDHRGLVMWIGERFRDQGKRIRVDAAEALAELKVEDDLRSIDSEISKLVTYAWDEKEITREDVENLVGRSKTDRIFELMGHVSNRRIAEAMGTVSDLMQANESPVGVVIMLASAVRQFIQIKLFLRSGGSWRPGIRFPEFRGTVLAGFKEWAEQRGIPDRDSLAAKNPYAAYYRFQEAEGFELDGLLVLLERLLDANRRLVSTSVRSKVVLEHLVASLAVD
jgi:DNA polymerase-3 subunit delta